MFILIEMANIAGDSDIVAALEFRLHRIFLEKCA